MHWIVKARRLREVLEDIEDECYKAGDRDPLLMAEALAYIRTRATTVLGETR